MHMVLWLLHQKSKTKQQNPRSPSTTYDFFLFFPREAIFAKPSKGLLISSYTKAQGNCLTVFVFL